MARARPPGWCGSGASCALWTRPACTPTIRCRWTAWTRLRVDDVRSVDQGFLRAANRIDIDIADSEDLIDDAQVMSGEENILSLFYTVHFSVSEPYAYRYRVADPAALVGGFAEWAVRQTVARRSSSEVLVTHRGAIEQEVLATLQAELDAVASGVRAVAVNVLDAHAPPAVHEAFRDVASSLEEPRPARSGRPRATTPKPWPRRAPKPFP